MQPEAERKPSEKPKFLASVKRFISSHTLTIAVLGATAGGHMIGRLPDNLFGRGVITSEWLIFAPLLLLAEGMWVLAILHDRSRLKDLPSQKVYSALIVVASLVLIFANNLSPYYRH